MSGVLKGMIVNVEDAARRVLADPKGLSKVGRADLQALAQYALTTQPMSAALAAELAKTVDAFARKRTSCLLADELEFTTAMTKLQTLFEKEFPNGSDHQ